MHRVGVIGSREGVIGFKTVGLDVFPCDDLETARRTLSKIAKEDFAIIFVTEGYAKDMLDIMEPYKTKKLPAIVPIPGMDGSYGLGYEKLKKSVERAVGVDILFEGDL